MSADKEDPGVSLRRFYVYVLSNHTRTLYVGVTNDLVRRAFEHKTKTPGRFTSRYNLTNVVYFEVTDNVRAAIVREKQLKGWTRRKKLALINSTNPEWR